MNGIDDLPRCPFCGGLPTLYRYYQDRDHPRHIVGMMCGDCRRGPDSGPTVDTLTNWIIYATKDTGQKG